MPNIKSMIKDLKRNAKRHARNQSTKSALKTYIKKARESFGKPEAESLVRIACKMLDKAAERGIIHKNQASRKKSRLMQAYNRSQTGA